MELVEEEAQLHEYDHRANQACNKMFPLYRCATDPATVRNKTFLQGLKRELEIDVAEIAFELNEAKRTKEWNKGYRAISEKTRCVRNSSRAAKEILKEYLEIAKQTVALILIRY